MPEIYYANKPDKWTPGLYACVCGVGGCNLKVIFLSPEAIVFKGIFNYWQRSTWGMTVLMGGKYIRVGDV